MVLQCVQLERLWSQEKYPNLLSFSLIMEQILYHITVTNDFEIGFDLVNFNSDGYYDMLYNVDGTFTKSTNIDVAYEVDDDGYKRKID